MITHNRIKIWTIISHAFILVGAGHGILSLIIIEIISFPYVTEKQFSFTFNSVDNHFAVVGLTSLLGQIAMIISIIHKKENYRRVFQVIGILLLWNSLLYFYVDTILDSYIHIAIFTAIPFFVCTLLTFLGKHLKRLFDWVVDV